MIDMGFAESANKLFDKAIEDYHIRDDVDHVCTNPFEAAAFDHLLYRKNMIDTVQWHLEDIIRNPSIDPDAALAVKRRIDSLNQERTDMVEHIDAYLLDEYGNVAVRPDATVNTETPAWAIDRLSILALKIYHMHIEANRTEADEAHRKTCVAKLDILLAQREDLSGAIDALIEDIAAGRKYMKPYRQMKMYNDPALNPVLYSKK